MNRSIGERLKLMRANQGLSQETLNGFLLSIKICCKPV